MTNLNLQAIPQQYDYVAALDLIDERFESQGGPWVATYREEMKATHGTELYLDYLVAGTIAYDLEPLDANEMPLDPLLKTTHAFKHGMLIGYKAIDMLHLGMIDEIGAATYLQTVVTAESGTYERADQFVELGERGLDLAGESARVRIDAWSKEVVSDPQVRRMYGLGCGAVIFAAHTVHSGYNELELQKYFEDYHWSE